MGLFLDNTGMSFLRDGSQLNREVLEEVKGRDTLEKVGAGDAAYRTYVFPSGLELILRESAVGVVDADMAYESRQIWQAKPVSMDLKKEYLGMTITMLSQDGKTGFVATLSKAALIPDFNETQMLDMAVSAFPIGLDVFDNRAAYEAASDDNTRLEDGQVFAFNYIMARQKGLTKKEEEYFTHKEAFNLLCGEVVDIQWKDNGWRDSGFYVVTVRTKMGNVDAIIGKKQLAKPCEKGCYVLMEAMLVCKVLAIDGKTV